MAHAISSVRTMQAHVLVALGGMAATSYAEVVNDPGNDENVEEKTAESIAPKQSLIPLDDGIYQSEQRLKNDLNKATGLSIALESTTIYQITSGSRPANQAV